MSRRTYEHLARWPVLADILAAAVEHPSADAAMKNVFRWVGLKELIGVSASVSQLLQYVANLDRNETMFTLARIACDLANGEGGVHGSRAHAWTTDLLKQSVASPNHLEASVAKALARSPETRAIAHAQGVFTLQTLVMARAGHSGVRPSDAYVAFLLLALNDHIPEWAIPSTTLPESETILADIFFTSIFNRNDDPLRVLVRTLDIFAKTPPQSPIKEPEWLRVTQEAFGTTLDEYAEGFLAPLFLFASGWGDDRLPLTSQSTWSELTGITRTLVDRWFDEASLLARGSQPTFSSRPLPSGLAGVPAEFYRKPFIEFETGHILGSSPWHVRDHLTFGTWGKLNAASKKVRATTSNEAFASHFGYQFEAWCADLAQESKRSDAFPDELILPSHTGAADEIEDVVLLNGKMVALISAKASLVPENSLKSAPGPDAVMKWLRRFFFEDTASAKAKGHRGGAVFQLDKHVQRLRAGEFEKRGISRNAIILPAIVCFDHVGECGPLYKWIEATCKGAGILSARRDVRPITLIAPRDFEALMALGASGISICEVLFGKSSDSLKWGNLDAHLFDVASETGTSVRLPVLSQRFQEVMTRVKARMTKAKELRDRA